MNLVQLFEVEEIAAAVCFFVGDGLSPASLTALPLVAPAFRTLLDKKSMGDVWRMMSTQRWKGLEVGLSNPQHQLPRVQNWKRFFRLRFLHLRDLSQDLGREPLPIENCALGLQAESTSSDLPDGLVWRLRCPIDPSKLEKTSHFGIDYCKECKKNVYWVTDEFELRRRAELGQCVYIDMGGKQGRKGGRRAPSIWDAPFGNNTGMVRIDPNAPPRPGRDDVNLLFNSSALSRINDELDSSGPTLSTKPDFWYADGPTNDQRMGIARQKMPSKPIQKRKIPCVIQ